MNERYRSRADTRCAGELRIVFTRESTSEIPGVDGHQDLPSDGHEVDAMAITESDRIRWSSRREPAPNAESGRLAISIGHTRVAVQISRLWHRLRPCHTHREGESCRSSSGSPSWPPASGGGSFALCPYRPACGQRARD
jgi:hypothetical protein